MDIKIKKNNLILIIVLSLIFICIGLISVFSVYSVGTTTDEFGYLFNASKIIYDWKNVMKYQAYYGQGIGFLWMPLFLLMNRPIVLYRSIIFLNYILLLLSVFIMIKCSFFLFPKWNNTIRILSCFLIICYPSYLYYSKIALPEILLFLLYWIMIYLIIKTLNSSSMIYPTLLGIISGYMIMVHLRTLAVFILLATFMVFLWITKKIELKKLNFFLLTIIVMYFIQVYLKNQYFISLPSTEVSKINSSISVLTLIESCFTDIKNVIIALLGKIYYLFSSGNILLWIGIIQIIYNIFLALKRKKIELNSLISLFIFGVFIANLIAFSVQMKDNIHRFDYVFYSRYIENLIGPILLYGIYEITNKKISANTIFSFFAVLIILTPIVMHRLEEIQGSVFAIDSAPAFGAYFDYYMDNCDFYLSLLKNLCYSSAIGMVIFYLNYLAFNWHQNLSNIFKMLAIITVIGFWGFLYYTADFKYTSIRNDLYFNYEKICNYIKEENPQNTKSIIYLKDKDDIFVNGAKYFQALLMANSITIDDIGNIDKYNTKNSIIIIPNSEYNDELKLKNSKTNTFDGYTVMMRN